MRQPDRKPTDELGFRKDRRTTTKQIELRLLLQSLDLAARRSGKQTSSASMRRMKPPVAPTATA